MELEYLMLCFTFCTTIKCQYCYVLLNTCILKIIEKNTCLTDVTQLQALLWRKYLFSQSHGHGMCPSFPVPQNHIFSVFSSSSRSRSELSTTCFSVEFDRKAVATLLFIFFFFLPELLPLLHNYVKYGIILGCIFTIWNSTHSHGRGFMRCWEASLMLMW